jgi:hypothetical protein
VDARTHSRVVFSLPFSSIFSRQAYIKTLGHHVLDNRGETFVFEEFVQFMNVFFNMHDAVVATLQSHFQQNLGVDTSDPAVTDQLSQILCPHIRFSADMNLDYEPMFQVSMHALVSFFCG